MSSILIFDTSVATENLGDLIILDAIRSQLRDLFPHSHFLNTATHDVISRPTYRLNRISNYSFVAGTNLLSSNMNSYNQWKINLFDSIFLKDIVLTGVGWWQYQKDPNLYTRTLLKRILHKDILHSVRDEYALKKIHAIGQKNVINTGCPTTWSLTPDFCANIPNTKSDSAVFTLTDYNKNRNTDIQLIHTLKSNYRDLFFWPQGTGDRDYINSLDIAGLNILTPSLEAYDELLSSNRSIDYVGTRLHAGIRALQYKRRSLILAIDNRAIEKQKDTNLPVIDRTDIDSIKNRITGKWKTDIRINEQAIATWKGQFVK